MYKEGVYDITRFVDHHPGGGQNVMLAAGGSVEPFWLLFGIHKDDKVLETLESMRIGKTLYTWYICVIILQYYLCLGNVSLDESREATKNMEDPYQYDPRRHPVLKARSKKPFNAEPLPSYLLVESFHTPK